jgi:hypothetical protein
MAKEVLQYPTGLHEAGRRLWRSITTEYELGEH